METVLKKKKNATMKGVRRAEHLFCLSILAWPVGFFLVVGIAANYIYPVVLAFQEIDPFGNISFAGFDNFVEYVKLMFTDGDLLKISFKYNVIMYLLNLVFSSFFCYLFGYLIFKKCVGYKAMRLVCFIPSAVSSMVFGLCFQKFVSTALPDILMNLGAERYIDMFSEPKYIFFILNFYMLWTSFTASIIIVPNSMAQIDPQLFEAGEIDGIQNMFQELWYIVFPGIWGVMATYFIIGVSSLFTSSGCTLLFYHNNAPKEAYNLGYYYMMLTLNESDTFYPVLAAGGLVMTALCAPLTFFVKWLTEKCPWSDY